MRTYNVVNIDMDGRLNPWKIVPQGFRFYQFSTGDRRTARKVVRLARRMGYRGVRFTTASSFPLYN